MVRLVLIRHAQAHCNIAGIVGGPQSCTGLTDHGRQQAALLAQRLQHDLSNEDLPAAIFSSPRRRAIETAAAVADALGLPNTELHDLRDPDYGPAADGQPWTTVTARARQSSSTSDMTVPLAPGGEPWSHYITRTADLIKRLTKQQPRAHIILIGHAETVQAAHQIFAGLPPMQKPPVRYEVENTSITLWRQRAATPIPCWTLVTHNDHHHLPRRRP
ncbi:histidine phosphatase family protein [Micromonospora fiedleri]|uniref:Histidine phosphatase family protein n=1 Tax=Micromonospora fiedleri TaxID=1157498 RepID=A0ABS1UUY8_9ACTN|nr:histidine phosphatase family protein [Micromonospora fiedleri]MBL6280172.1 histidine phosphatase family protein [Micromonospora fiedleri]